MWTRRKFLETSFLTQMAMGSGLLSQLYSCVPNEKSVKILNPELQKILTAAMDEIIPAGDGMPSASEADGLNYLLNLFEQFPDLATQLSNDLSDFNNLCLEKFKKGFTEITSNERVAMLQHQEKENATFFKQLKDYTYESYYLSPKVWELIHYQPYPTLSSGPEMDAFDETLLKRVQSLPSKYKVV